MKRRPDEAKVIVLFRGRGVAPGWPEELAAAQRHTTVSIQGQVLSRVRHGGEKRRAAAPGGPCHDCAAAEGEFHVPGCDMELCPACGGQAISCGCVRDR